jgi:hypothetical protein
MFNNLQSQLPFNQRPTLFLLLLLLLLLFGTQH